MPVAVKLVVVPFATVAVVGVMAIAVSADAVKLAVLEVRPFAEAVTDALPSAKVDAMPLMLSVAIVVLLDAQVTDPEIFPVLPSE